MFNTQKNRIKSEKRKIIVGAYRYKNVIKKLALIWNGAVFFYDRFLQQHNLNLIILFKHLFKNFIIAYLLIYIKFFVFPIFLNIFFFSFFFTLYHWRSRYAILQTKK